MKVLLLLSGPSAVGKSLLSNFLTEHHHFSRVTTSGYLRTIAESRSKLVSKAALQELGDDLDSQTNFGWVVDLVARPTFERFPAVSRWLVDSVRKCQQVAAFRTSFGTCVFHAHLTAPEEMLRARYECREQGRGTVTTPYEDVVAHPNEISARSLQSVADVVFDLAYVTQELAVRAILDECLKREI